MNSLKRETKCYFAGKREANKMSAVGFTCTTPECGNKATLQCPTCLKIGIQGSFFCGQDCFKGYWKTHKIIHLLGSEL